MRAIIASALLLIALGGCWKSDTPLVSPESDAAFDMTGVWVRDGQYNSGIRYDISLDDDGYWFADYLADVYKPEADDRLLTFAPLRGDWYLAQIMKTDGNVEAYAVAKAAQSQSGTIDHLDAYESYCSEQIGAMDRVAEDARGDCVFSDLETLTAAAEAQIELIEGGSDDIAIYASYSRVKTP